MTTLDSKPVAETLDRLFLDAESNDPPIMERLRAEAAQRGIPFDDKLASENLGEAYLSIDRHTGRFLHTLALAHASRTIVEFGTSFGISTIYLTAAVRDNGGGRVITAEQVAGKVRQARQNLTRAGLDDLVDFREGDALETLADLDRPIDLLFLDGWKGLYLPVLKLLETKLRPGAVILADDLDIFPELIRPYLEYVRHPDNGYVSVEVPIGDGLELSVRRC
jgi:predicted O-methyltransferase YrrM